MSERRASRTKMSTRPLVTRAPEKVRGDVFDLVRLVEDHRVVVGDGARVFTRLAAA